MAGFIPNKVLEEIKDRTDIVDLIGRYVNLKKAGANYKGICPFHNEKTPSFVVSEDKQIFTCFGCEKSGDAITFMQYYFNLDFSEAAQKLADEAGIVIPENETIGNDRAKSLYELNREAAIFFFKNLRLTNNPGYSYMINRGLTDDTLKKFGIGWADDSRDSLYRYLKAKGYDEKTMMEAGLLSTSDGRYYDKFRNRVIFPIQNRRGKMIGFGGRAMGDAMPKYLNSPETGIFKKKDNLYGLNITGREIGRQDQAILVEGYMDVISLYQGGVKNVTASLGTALTENQAKILGKMSGNIVLSYDSDEAGVKATLRAMDILRKASCHVSIAHVRDAKDPDEFIKKYGREEFLKLVKGSKSFGEYKIDLAGKKYDLNDIDHRIKFMEDVVKILSNLPRIEQEIYAKYMSDRYGISEQAVLSGTDSGISVKNEVRRRRKAENTNDSALSNFEKTLIKILMTDSHYIEYRNDYIDMFETPMGRGILQDILENYQPKKDLDIDKLTMDMDPKLKEAVIYIKDNVPLSDDVDSVYKECIRTREKAMLRKERDDILMMMSMGEGNEDSKSYINMSKRLNEIFKLLKEF